MSKVVTLYNHKGGVSKTTTTFNLAHLLADKGDKVLVIDADPQCNMTEILLAPLIERLDAEAEKSGMPNELPGTTLLDVLKPRIDGATPNVDINAVEVVKVKDNLDLLRGDVALNSIEDALAEAHIQRFSNKTHEKRTYVSLGDFLTRFGEKNGYKYIFLDVGPSSGALTRSAFLACDAFFIPVSPDRFCVQAISTLSTIINRWLREHSEIYDDFLKLGLPIKHGKPQFLGIISQYFKVLAGRPKPGYKLWMNRIPESVVINLLPLLKKHSTIDRDLTSGMDNTNVTVTEIPDFGSLAPLMQECGKAVFNISQRDTALITEKGVPWGGQTWTDGQRRMDQFKADFEKIVTRLEWIK